MTDWFSKRFECDVRLTKYAVARMHERQISRDVIRELIEIGQVKPKDDQHLWIYKAFEERNDNLICAAVVLEDKLVIKTIMHRWQLMEVKNEN